MGDNAYLQAIGLKKRIMPANSLKSRENGCNHRSLSCGERLFVAVVRLSLKDDREFITQGEYLEKLADMLGVSYKTCDCIRIKLSRP